MSTLRAEKTTKNRDDFRVLLAGTVFAIFLMVANPFIMKVWDFRFAPRPFVTATLEVVQRGGAAPYILYDADANELVDGTWIASMVDGEGTRLLTREGLGNYSDKVDGPKPWTWFAFFDNDKGLNSPGVPNVPFRVCVRYVVSTMDSGAQDESPTYCSNLFNPNG